MRRRAIGLILVATGGAVPALAAPWTITGSATARAGIESNPFLGSNGQTAFGNSNGNTGLSGVGGFTATATATQETALSSTTLMGSADFGFYTSNYGNNNNFLVSLNRVQHINEHIQLNGTFNYQNTLNPQNNFGFDPTVDTSTSLDFLTVGARNQRFDGQLFLDWQLNTRDSLRLGGNASHSIYKSQFGSDYDQFGGNFDYLHRLSDRTQIGLSGNLTHVRNSGTPSSDAYQLTVQLVRKLNAHWDLSAGIGGVKQKGGRTLGGTIIPNAFTSNKVTLAFNGSLCGNYTRANGCLTVSRTAAPSGIGGLRTDTQVLANATYQLTERSRATVAATFDLSSGGTATIIPQQRYYDLNLTYSRQLTGRISVGATGRVQRRETEDSILFPGQSPTGYSLNATLSYSFGRIGRIGI